MMQVYNLKKVRLSVFKKHFSEIVQALAG